MRSPRPIAASAPSPWSPRPTSKGNQARRADAGRLRVARRGPGLRPAQRPADHDDWTRLLQEAGVRPHDRRHTAVTVLLGENVPPRVVMELLGHSQMRTTMDIYSHVMPALAREAADPHGRRAADEQDIANCNHEDR
jgi:integrase